MSGKTLIFRDAMVDDAEKILNLRTDAKKGRFLSATSNSIESQPAWLRPYTEQSCFIIQRDGEVVGIVHLYDTRVRSIYWGSWIIAESQPAHVAIEAPLIVYAYALHHLGFHQAHFDVSKAKRRGGDSASALVPSAWGNSETITFMSLPMMKLGAHPCAIRSTCSVVFGSLDEVNSRASTQYKNACIVNACIPRVKR